MTEGVLYSARPAMFRGRPFLFVLLVLLVPLAGLGLILLLVWWLKCMGTRLIVTEQTVVKREGILSKQITEVMHRDVRNITVRQSPFQRLFRVGYIGIATAGHAGVEIEVSGIPDPEQVRRIINLRRAG